ncbi:MAG: CstA-like transporter-associated (seleno)protein [Sphingomonas sp.]
MPWLHEAWRQAARTARLMVGVPDYDAYVVHRHAEHPGEPVMTLAEFHRNRLERRYGGGPDRVSRCC